MNTKYSFSTPALIGMLICLPVADAGTYHVVVSSDGIPAFDDCITLAKGGRLYLERDPVELSWMSGSEELMATTVGSDRTDTTVRLALHLALQDDGVISGNAVNGYGLRFYFSGTASDKCSVDDAAEVAGGSAYGSRPVRAAVRLDTAKPGAAGINVFLPGDCFGFDCGPPPQPKIAAGNTVTGDSGAEVYLPGDCFGFDCGLPPQPRIADWYQVSQISDLTMIPSFCDYNPCGVLPEPRKGDRPRIAGQAYRVILQSEQVGTDMLEDCWQFNEDNTLTSSSGLAFVWANESIAAGTTIATDPTAFQAVGRSGSRHGMALGGRLSGPGQLEIKVIQSVRGWTGLYQGYGFPVRGC
ncbi:MAG: hypothetical protein KJO54_08310 [Gammaproteobacteria bacterium]|nr:hypothetical protein [Gammaproteobacteria bacterium]NNM21600.1 hypothetical protein [Gammaproteobacteria bacterium]